MFSGTWYGYFISILGSMRMVEHRNYGMPQPKFLRLPGFVRFGSLHAARLATKCADIYTYICIYAWHTRHPRMIPVNTSVLLVIVYTVIIQQYATCVDNFGGSEIISGLRFSFN